MLTLLLARTFSLATTPSVGIIGGGMAGVTAARTIAANGVAVTLYERDERLGGRLGSLPLNVVGRNEPLLVGAGCSYIKGDDAAFIQQLKSWEAEGTLVQWDGRPHSVSAGTGLSEPLPMEDDEIWYCGAPAAASPLDLSASELSLIDVRRELSVTQATWDGIWSLEAEDLSPQAAASAPRALAQHEALVLAIPVADAAALLARPAEQALLDRALPVEMRHSDFCKARFAAALAFESSLELPFRLGLPKSSFITVMIDDSSRRARAGSLSSSAAEVWVLQSDTAWAQERLIMARRDEISLGEVADELATELARVLGRDALPPLAGCAIVPWVYGDCDYGLEGGCAWLEDAQLAFAGDWAYNGRLQGAWLSGRAAARRVLDARSEGRRTQ